MTYTDIHTHTTFSPDGKDTPEDMIAAARRLGVTHYGIADHFNFDYDAVGLLFDGQPIPSIDARGYFTHLREIQARLKETDPNFLLTVGGEFGFAPDSSCYDGYAEIIDRYHPDFVVNSIHTVGDSDCWFAHYFEGKSKKKAYSDYLEAVRKSLDAPYRYDIVAHLGYVARNAPYADRKLRYCDFSDIIDDILRTVIAKGKILEVNTSARSAGSEFIPDVDILTRYRQLGGDKISISSDAHDVSRICEKYDLVVSALKTIGFSYLTVPDRGKEIKLPL